MEWARIIRNGSEPTGFYCGATCGKTSAFVSITKHGFRVCCKNACHDVWRGAGRGFETLADALAGYKSPEMRAIIQAAAIEAAGNVSVGSPVPPIGKGAA